MSDDTDRESYAIPMWKFWVTLTLTLGAVLAGTWFVMWGEDRAAHKPQRQRPLRGEPARLPAMRLGPWTNGMVWIPGGTFWMGSDTGAADERPIHKITVDGFWMDRTEVTNDEFERFVADTGYVTLAERAPEPREAPSAPGTESLPGAWCFRPPTNVVSLTHHAQWWSWTPGANWRHPDGPGSTIEGRGRHPVVQVAWDDVIAYCNWAGKRLSTEAEWEYAARGGRDRKPFMWGDSFTPGNQFRANTWQGEFPRVNTGQDGHAAIAPVGTFPPNDFGVRDLAGNVWEWRADWYRPDAYVGGPLRNPPGPDQSFDPAEPGVAKRVMRGGSYLCLEVYCAGYRPNVRMKARPDAGFAHTGFRCVRSE